MRVTGRSFLAVRTAFVVGLFVLLTEVGRTQQPTASRATDLNLTAQQRAEELLQQMTIEEKAMQLSSVFPVALFGADGPIHSQLDAQLKQRHRACFRARPDRAQDARADREVGQRRPALPGDGDAAQDPGDLPQRGDERRGGAALHGSSPPRSGSRRRGTPRRWRRWPTSSGARCGRWASSRRCRPSWTWPAMPVGGG